MTDKIECRLSISALQHTEINSPCEPNPCFRGVRCSVTSSTGFACGPCPPGYTGDGVRCVRKITCDEQPCFEGNTGCSSHKQSPSLFMLFRA